MAVGAGIVWSFGAIASRLADQSDAFQYMIWRSIGIITVVEIMATIRPLKPFPTIHRVAQRASDGHSPIWDCSWPRSASCTR